ncbi:transposase [Methylobacterium oryzae CBMB20]
MRSSPARLTNACWVHKTANVLDKVPKSVQPAMKADLREIHGAPTRAAAEVAPGRLRREVRGQARARCRLPDQGPGGAAGAFYDFPAEHWDHLRSSNPIESVFATVRHRTVRTKGALSATTAKLMVFKLVMAASKTWRRLKSENQLPKVVAGVIFRDGTEVTASPDHRAA